MRQRMVHVSEADRHDFPWGSITWLHSGAFSGSEELTLGDVIIIAGKSNPVHTHANCEEVLFLLEGELEHTCGDEKPYHMTPGSSICIQRGIPHNAKCVSNVDAWMVVAYSSPCREMQGE